MILWGSVWEYDDPVGTWHSSHVSYPDKRDTPVDTNDITQRINSDILLGNTDILVGNTEILVVNTVTPVVISNNTGAVSNVWHFTILRC